MPELVKYTARPRRTNVNVLISVWTIGPVLAAAAGPFGTYASHSFGQRLVFWGIVIFVSTLFGMTLRYLAERIVPADYPLGRDGLLVVLMSLVFTPFVWLLAVQMSPTPGTGTPNYGRTMVFVGLISVAVCMARRVIEHNFGPAAQLPAEAGAKPVPERPADPVAATEPGSEPDLPRLRRRLPSDFDGNIIRLNVKDHQVNVVTTEGDYALRLRFGDAVDEMDPVDGFCTHRSHWVARRAVSGAERERGKTFLRLVNGDRVPVSRTYMPELEEAGLL